MPVIEQAVSPGYEGYHQYVIEAKYDFAVQGGAVGTIALLGGLVIPSGLTVYDGFIDITTPLTSGGAATIALQLNAANDLATATAVASWTAGVKNVLPALTSGSVTATTAIRTTAKRDISMVIGTAALTAGVFRVVLFTVPPLKA